MQLVPASPGRFSTRPSAAARIGLLSVAVIACSQAFPPPSGRIALPTPGRPYTADAMLAVLEAAPAPMIPRELRRAELAAALAEQIWTIDGRRHEAIEVFVTCEASCRLSVLAGPPDRFAARDLYDFTVDRETLDVALQSSELWAPTGLAAQLDAMAQAAAPEQLEGLFYERAAWLPPPEFGRFVLEYQKFVADGGTQTVHVLLDTRLGQVIRIDDPTSRVDRARLSSWNRLDTATDQPHSALAMTLGLRTTTLQQPSRTRDGSA
jgi:hypothetical protein